MVQNGSSHIVLLILPPSLPTSYYTHWLKGTCLCDIPCSKPVDVNSCITVHWCALEDCEGGAELALAQHCTHPPCPHPLPYMLSGQCTNHPAQMNCTLNPVFYVSHSHNTHMIYSEGFSSLSLPKWIAI